MGNYVIEVGNYVIVNPSELGNYKIADTSGTLPIPALSCIFQTRPARLGKATQMEVDQVNHYDYVIVGGVGRLRPGRAAVRGRRQPGAAA
jgi:hypothetical protein